MDELWVVGVTDGLYGAYLGVTGIRTHTPDKCAGRNCVVHNPSEHHLLSWPIVYRSDKGTVERTCLHGVGHPDPDDAAFQKANGRDYLLIHGCDGCCVRD